MKKLIAAAGLGAALLAGPLLGAGTAHADVMSDDEREFAVENARGVCKVLNVYPTYDGVEGAVAGVMGAGFGARQAGRIVMFSAMTECPRHTDLLLSWADSVDDEPSTPS